MKSGEDENAQPATTPTKGHQDVPGHTATDPDLEHPDLTGVVRAEELLAAARRARLTERTATV